VIFCGGFVYVDAGEPAWFAAASDDDRLVFRIGCSSLDRAGSIYHYVPGPWQDERSMCAADGLAFSLDEFEAEVRLRASRSPSFKCIRRSKRLRFCIARMRPYFFANKSLRGPSGTQYGDANPGPERCIKRCRRLPRLARLMRPSRI
jgi:hypothetical protein